MDSEPSDFTPLDLVFYKGKDGKHMAGGFEVQSLSSNVKTQHGGSAQSVIFAGLKNLAVPAGLFFLQQNTKKNYQVVNKDEVVTDNLYDKLVNLASIEENNKPKKTSTRKKVINKTKRNKTKRNKK